MTKNRLGDLHDHLMARVEALGDETVKGQALKDEIARSRAAAQVAGTIIDNARLALDAEKHFASRSNGAAHEKRPAMLTVERNG